MNETISEIIQALEKVTGRNALVYYITDHRGSNLYEKGFNEYDVARLGNCLSDMPKDKGLDIILRGSGVRMDDVEKIVKYLKEELHGDLRVIVPEHASGAGSVLACSAKEIIMGENAVLGSAEPYIGSYMANSIVKIYQDTKMIMESDPGYYARISNKKSKFLAMKAKKAAGNKKAAPLYIKLTDEVLTAALYSAMFDPENAADRKKVKKIISTLNDKKRLSDKQKNEYEDTGKPYPIEECQAIQLKVMNLKDAQIEKEIDALYQAVAQTYEGTDIDKVILTSKKAEEVCTLAGVPSPFDDAAARAKIKELESYTRRNVLVYYSDIYSEEHGNKLGVAEGDCDKLRVCMNRLDSSKGLDIILHTPGGGTTETGKIIELINEYRMKNNDIRVIVPQFAMSAGTVLASASKEILMGYQTSLGPYDVQLGSLGAVSDLLYEVEKAIEEMQSNPSSRSYWNAILSRYGRVWNVLMGTPSTQFESIMKNDPEGKGRNLIENLRATMQDIRSTSELNEKKALGLLMFNAKDPNDAMTIDYIAETLNDRVIAKTHGRRYNYAFCKEIGLKVKLIEEDPELQQLVYELHDMYLSAFRNNNVAKIISVSNMKPYVTPLA